MVAHRSARLRARKIHAEQVLSQADEVAVLETNVVADGQVGPVRGVEIGEHVVLRFVVPGDHRVTPRHEWIRGEYDIPGLAPNGRFVAHQMIDVARHALDGPLAKPRAAGRRRGAEYEDAVLNGVAQSPLRMVHEIEL